jgi:hypothetical protein
MLKGTEEDDGCLRLLPLCVLWTTAPKRVLKPKAEFVNLAMDETKEDAARNNIVQRLCRERPSNLSLFVTSKGCDNGLLEPRSKPVFVPDAKGHALRAKEVLVDAVFAPDVRSLHGLQADCLPST